MVDDLDQVNCYNKTIIKSPNIDDHASDSYLYENAVCNYPVCGASKPSMLTGLRPNKNRFKTFKSKIDVDAPSVETIRSWILKITTITLSFGKIHTRTTLQRVELRRHGGLKKSGEYQTDNIKLANQNNGVVMLLK